MISGIRLKITLPTQFLRRIKEKMLKFHVMQLTSYAIPSKTCSQRNIYFEISAPSHTHTQKTTINYHVDKLKVNHKVDGGGEGGVRVSGTVHERKKSSFDARVSLFAPS